MICINVVALGCHCCKRIGVTAFTVCSCLMLPRTCREATAAVTRTVFPLIDRLVDGHLFRIPCVIDDFNQECLANALNNSLSGERLTRELDAITGRLGYPCMSIIR